MRPPSWRNLVGLFARRPRRPPAGKRSRPLLEALEDRTLLTPAPFPVFGTGLDSSGSVLAGGTVDPNYELIGSADTSFPGPNAVVLNEGPPISPNGPWVANGPNSKWISVQPNNPPNAAPGNYTYQTTFDLTGFDPGTAQLTGQWATGNAGILAMTEEPVFLAVLDLAAHGTAQTGRRVVRSSGVPVGGPRPGRPTGSTRKRS
jgi:hypothetical protein